MRVWGPRYIYIHRRSTDRAGGGWTIINCRPWLGGLKKTCRLNSCPFDFSLGWIAHFIIIFLFNFACCWDVGGGRSSPSQWAVKKPPLWRSRRRKVSCQISFSFFFGAEKKKKTGLWSGNVICILYIYIYRERGSILSCLRPPFFFFYVILHHFLSVIREHI